ncbi:hypothetical protein HO173_009241 [Letharia columbiana]|uniref:Uncharacterized protein n=1 Tax=Letharia columbiana TaxID=112416 RepID=A0A8H6FQ16_9LECA|nr:uncharacterized protein HO173_009241 [Letharia columbiana]KAF6232573.1 hypothetical protein HO173_009241 [Letharia columbiana]
MVLQAVEVLRIKVKEFGKCQTGEMVQWKKLFGLNSQDRRGLREEMRRRKYMPLFQGMSVLNG